MTVNNRIFYACQAVGIKPCYDADGTTPSTEKVTPIHGAQSVGINTTFNLEQAFELGMIQIYENIEGLPDVEVTMEKVIDGYPLLLHLATKHTSNANITSRSKERCSVSLGIYGDDKDVVSGVAPVEAFASGMYFSSVGYTLPADGNCTEALTFVGNDKFWYDKDSPNIYGFDGGNLGNGITVESGYKIQDNFTGADEPLALDDGAGNFKGGIQRRENVRIDASEFPIGIFGVDGTGSGNAYNATTKCPNVHMQNISISTDASREDILELGCKAPYYRAPNFPIEVTCEIEAIAISGDRTEAISTGRVDYIGTKNEGNNTAEETIVVKLNDGTVFDLGTKNRLSSVTYGGGDAGGGNASITYSYSNFNDLRVLHPTDPASGVYSAGETASVTF